MCPTFWISSFLLSTFTSDSYTLHGPILVCNAQTKDILGIQSSWVPTQLSSSVWSPSVSICPSLWKLSFLHKGHTWEYSSSLCCLTHYFEYNNGFTNYWLTDKRVSSFKPKSERKRSQIHCTDPECDLSDQDGGTTTGLHWFLFSPLWPNTERAPERSVFWSTVHQEADAGAVLLAHSSLVRKLRKRHVDAQLAFSFPYLIRLLHSPQSMAEISTHAHNYLFLETSSQTH